MTRIGEQWTRNEYERSGQVAGLFFKVDDREDEYIMVAAFPDRESYFANADHPNTRENYQRMRELLVADPEWNDGEIVDILGIHNGI